MATDNSTGRTMYLRFVASALVVASLAVVAAVPLYYIDSRYDARLEAAESSDSRFAVLAVMTAKPALYELWQVLLAFAGLGYAAVLAMGWVSWLTTGRMYR